MASPDDHPTPAERAKRRAEEAFAREDFAGAAAEFATARNLFLAAGDESIQAARIGLNLSQALIKLGALADAEALLAELGDEVDGYRTHAAPHRENLGRIAHLRGQAEDALHHLTAALQLYEARQIVDVQQASCANALAAVQLSMGSYADADASLRTALGVCESEELPAEEVRRLVPEIKAQRALVAAATGLYQAAIDELLRIRHEALAAGFESTANTCTANLGFVHMQRGDAATAIEEYATARTSYESAGDATSAAICRLNIAVAGRIGGSATAESAIAEYEAAHPVLAQAGRHELAATCVLNIGVERHGIGDLSGAERNYVTARDQFAGLHGQERSVAMCELGLGRLHADRGNPSEARTALASARRRFAKLNLEEWTARCSVELSAVLADDTAADELVPAMLALDAIRFQFPTASSRHAWRTSTEHATQRAFELADRVGDRRLLAELVETAINSGVHTMSRHSSHVALNTTPDTNPAHTSPAAARTSGTSRLLAGAELPLAPAPALQMAAGRVALVTHRSTARRLYPALMAQTASSTPANAHDVAVSTW